MADNGKKGWWQLAAAIFMLVVLPVGSWFYLQKGADFRRQQLSEMDSLGVVKLPGLTKWDGLEIPADSFFQQTIIIGKMVAGESEMIEQAKLLADQFGDRQDLWLIVFTDSADVRTVFSEVELSCKRCVFARTNSVVFANFEQMENTVKGQAFWVLVDKRGEARRFYEPAELEKLIVHAAVLLPGDGRKKIDLKRSKER